MAQEELAKICLNCNSFFPDKMDEPTDFGICLNDPDFEPYIDELFENSNYASCQDIINRKRIHRERKSCFDFDPVEEGVELPDELLFDKDGRVNIENIRAYLAINNTDWSKIQVDDHIHALRGDNLQEKDSAITTLAFYSSQGNKTASMELLKYFKEIPVPVTLEDVHFKLKVFHGLQYAVRERDLIPILVDQLYQTPSSNTTRQWISEMFRFLERHFTEETKRHLEEMLTSNKFSHKIKRKIENILTYED